MVPAYRPEPLTDFSRESNRHVMTAALDEVSARLGARYPLVIGPDRLETEATVASLNPSDPAQVIGYAASGGAEHAERAMDTALEAFKHWSRVPHRARGRVLLKAAAIMRRRKFELAAWEILEAGKSWPEADADVAEAIDFLEYYGRQAMDLELPQPITPLSGEDDELDYIPLGVGLCIPPWNFPLAIPTGMTSAAIAAGNAVIFKPARPTPVIAYQLVEIFEQAGLPPGVLTFLTGDSSVVGEPLVCHPKMRFISFTGSREVGLRINRLAAETGEGQIWIKRVIAEMGGKDAIVVDSSADLAAAADGIVTSAFGFQGQKCSACSRAILLDDVYDAVLSGVVERTARLRLGPVRDYQNNVGPVIDESAYKKILGYIEVGKGEGRLMIGGAAAESPGYFIQPTVFADVQPGARIEQEEIFGPVLAVIRARSFDHALEIANDTIYGLTGSVYARERARIEQARREFHVGNLYINRKCTGAIVGVHPFGGFNLSGTDSKAGGPDYVKLFMQAKSVAEAL
ncbi:MAG TPA: L-glutamate gamma-semialdehyde dehydrogenase [Chloroflexota bacterium]|nr:L-glutamate gamma-semialdehyde dehydrogenase [Chloroflexota bacterium]